MEYRTVSKPSITKRNITQSNVTTQKSNDKSLTSKSREDVTSKVLSTIINLQKTIICALNTMHKRLQYLTTYNFIHDAVVISNNNERISNITEHVNELQRCIDELKHSYQDNTSVLKDDLQKSLYSELDVLQKNIKHNQELYINSHIHNTDSHLKQLIKDEIKSYTMDLEQSLKLDIKTRFETLGTIADPKSHLIQLENTIKQNISASIREEFHKHSDSVEYRLKQDSKNNLLLIQQSIKDELEKYVQTSISHVESNLTNKIHNYQTCITKFENKLDQLLQSNPGNRQHINDISVLIKQIENVCEHLEVSDTIPPSPISPISPTSLPSSSELHQD